jgi:hypothetical protein
VQYFLTGRHLQCTDVYNYLPTLTFKQYWSKWSHLQCWQQYYPLHLSF